MHECIIWPKVIALLKAQGLSQKAVAARLGVNQSTICRLAEGTAPEPRWRMGAALIELAGGVDRLKEAGVDVAQYLSGTNAAAPAHPMRRATDRPHPLRRSSDVSPGTPTAAVD